MTCILSLQSDFVTNDSKPTGEPRLLGEMEEWCDAEIKGHYAIYFATMVSRRKPNCPFEIIFQDDSDAVHFKMMWL